MEVFTSRCLLGVSEGFQAYFAYIPRATCSWGFINYRQRAHSGTAKRPVAESSWWTQPEKQCLPSSGTAGEVSQYRPVGTMLGRSLTCLGQSRLWWAHPPFCKPHFSCWVYTNKTHNFLMGELGMCSKIANCLQSLQKTHGEFTKMLLQSVVQMCSSSARATSLLSIKQAAT